MTFVYRGKGFERLADFESRILDQFPHAEPMRTMDAPTEEEKEDAKQRVQIIKVNSNIPKHTCYNLMSFLFVFFGKTL